MILSSRETLLSKDGSVSFFWIRKIARRENNFPAGAEAKKHDVINSPAASS